MRQRGCDAERQTGSTGSGAGLKEAGQQRQSLDPADRYACRHKQAEIDEQDCAGIAHGILGDSAVEAGDIVLAAEYRDRCKKQHGNS